MNRYVAGIVLLLNLVFSCPAQANTTSITFNNTELLNEVNNCEVINDTSLIKKGRFIAVVSSFSTLYIGSMAYLQYVWYKDHERVPFQYYNDSRGYNQVDKFGHAYGAYLQSYIGFHSLRWAGVPRKKAALYGG